jgi:hypothetical protein
VDRERSGRIVLGIKEKYRIDGGGIQGGIVKIEECMQMDR